MGDLLDEALAEMADHAPEYAAFGGRVALANHGPMVVDSLAALGRDDAITEWVEHYERRLEPAPARRGRVGDDWPEAVGDLSRVRDWVDRFDHELAAAPWQAVLDQWVLRLAAGLAGGVHGAIRTAHAARMLGWGDSPERLHELAEGLAYWAATWAPLPDAYPPPSGLLPSEALPLVEQLDILDRTRWRLFTEPMSKLADLPSFADVASLVDGRVDFDNVLRDMARTFAGLLVANNAEVNPRAMCHALTGGTIAALLQPHVSDLATAAMIRHGWQVAAAFYSAIGLHPPARIVEVPAVSNDDLIDLAIECPDEHAIKVTEICLRPWGEAPDPVLLAAAASTTRWLNDASFR